MDLDATLKRNSLWTGVSTFSGFPNQRRLRKVLMLKEHEIQIRVRYKETDAMGYLHHANYFVYFEMGRTELLRAQGGNYRQMEDEGFLMVVVRLNCRFKLPARYDDLLTLKTRVTKVGMAKLEHAYELWRGDILLAEAESTLGCVDRDGKVQVMPAHIRGEAS